MPRKERNSVNIGSGKHSSRSALTSMISMRTEFLTGSLRLRVAASWALRKWTSTYPRRYEGIPSGLTPCWPPARPREESRLGGIGVLRKNFICTTLPVGTTAAASAFSIARGGPKKLCRVSERADRTHLYSLPWPWRLDSRPAFQSRAANVAQRAITSRRVYEIKVGFGFLA